MCIPIIEVLFVITLTKCLLEQADIVVLEYGDFKIIISERHRNVPYIIFLSVIKMQIEL